MAIPWPHPHPCPITLSELQHHTSQHSPRTLHKETLPPPTRARPETSAVYIPVSSICSARARLHFAHSIASYCSTLTIRTLRRPIGKAIHPSKPMPPHLHLYLFLRCLPTLLHQGFPEPCRDRVQKCRHPLHPTECRLQLPLESVTLQSTTGA